MSRSQLSKAYLQGDYTALQEALGVQNDDRLESRGDKEPADLASPIERIVAEVVGSVFAIEPSLLRRSSNIFDMGASSMHLLRVKQRIHARLSLANIPIIELLGRPQIGELCDYLSELVALKQSGNSQDVDYQPLVCFNPEGTKPPLFLIHPGVGEVLVFMGLSRSLADDRPIYALRARGFDSDEDTFRTFDEMVDTYVTAIEHQYPSGPYYIAGYSFGGAVAFEIGQRLEARGKAVPWLGVLNLPPHIEWRMKQLTWLEVLINITLFLSLIPSAAMDAVRHNLSEAFPDVAERDTEPPRPLRPIRWLFERSDKDRLAELDLELSAFIRWIKVAYELNRTGRAFEPRGRVAGALTTVFCATPLPSMGTREEYKRERLSAWKEFSGERFEMVDVEGQHYTMLAPEHVESFAEHLRGALRRADEGRR
jgi:thioesterase domain-containing protein